MSHLRITDLKKSYGSLQILKGISLDIRSGEFISLLGPSGSGKTTILRCIAGLEKPDANSGTVQLADRKLSGGGIFVPPEKRNLGMVFQNYAVWPHMTVFENVAFPLRIGGKDASQVTEKVSHTLALVKLDALKDRYPHQLSGGQQQRVALARALAMSPALLLLDEPLSNLDALLREELGAEIRRLQKNLNLTTILVTHDQKEALSLSDRIVVLNQGQIEADGAPEELYVRPPSPFVAGFIAGGQLVKVKSTGQSQLFLPRRWALTQGSSRFQVKLSSRIYLGSEYEYWGESAELSEPIRFFSNEKHEIGSLASLEYREKSDKL